MKKFAIALILLAAAPAVATASSCFMNEVTGGSEIVSSSAPLDDVSYVSTKSSRPMQQQHWSSQVEQPMTGKITPDWM